MALESRGSHVCEPTNLRYGLSVQTVIHYTSHNGMLHHFLHGGHVEEQVTADHSYFVATGPKAFEDGKLVLVYRHKPGVVLVTLRHGDNCQLVFSRDEFLPAGTQIL